MTIEEDKKRLEELCYMVQNQTYDDFTNCEKEMCDIHQKYIDEFNEHLIKEQYSKKVIRKHINNVEDFLLYFMPYHFYYNIFSGPDGFVDYFSGWCIDKRCCSKEPLKEAITAISVFYKYLLSKGYVDENKVKEGLYIIKTFKDEWFEMAEDPIIYY